MKIKRILDDKGQLIRLEPADDWGDRLRILVQNVVDSGEGEGDYLELPDDLVMPSGVQDHPVKELADRGAKIVTLDFTVRAADDDSEDNPSLIFRATDESEDRHGSVIRFAGWDWSWYMRTGEGVFLYCHDYEFPAIGKTTKISKLPQLKAHDFTVRYAVKQWAIENMPNWARLCYRLAKDNFMPQVSVGFIPKNAKAYTPKTLGIFGAQGDGVEFLEQEGLELSQVTVGSNRNAYGVKAAIRRGIVSENEVAASGLGRLLFNSADVYHVNEATLDNKIAALRDPERRKLAVSTLPPSAWRTKPAVADDESVPAKKPKKKPPIGDDDVMTAEKALYGPMDASLPESVREIGVMKEVLRQEYDALEIYLRAFKSAAHSGWLSMMASAMASSMWRIADILYNLEWWYALPQDLGEFILLTQDANGAIEDAIGPVETRDATRAQIGLAFAPLAELRAVDVVRSGRRSFGVRTPDVAAKSVREVITRVGKVLSKKNFDKLTTCLSLIEEVCIDGGWDPADIETEEEKSTSPAAPGAFLDALTRALVARAKKPVPTEETDPDDTPVVDDDDVDGEGKPKKKPAVKDEKAIDDQLLLGLVEDLGIVLE